MSDRVERLRRETVLDPEGRVVPMSEVLDRSGRTVLAFIRHFG